MNLVALMLRSLPAVVGLPVWLIAQEPALELPALFTDHMVLQREMAVPLWGKAVPGAQVTVRFRSQEKSTTAGADGTWRLTLEPLLAGGPDNLTVNHLTITDVLVGEVWIGSGQSNMALPATARFFASDKRLASLTAATYPGIRLFSASGSGHDKWLEAAPATNPAFSATLFAFGVPLQRELQVPVGLVLGAVGGTPSGYWLSEQAYRSDPSCQQAIAAYEAAHPFAAQQRQYVSDKALYVQALAASAGSATTSHLVPPRLPIRAGEPPAQQRVGQLYESRIRPLIPYAIRGVLWNQGESGTALVGVDQHTVMGALIRSWRRDWGQGDFPFIYVQKPSGGGPAWDYDDPVTSRADPFVPQVGKAPRANDLSGAAREEHLRIMANPATFMVATSDLGSGMHPTNKSGYGEREARVALGAVYGRKLEISGPLYQSCSIEGERIRIRFSHLGAGLAFRNGDRLQGFAIAGEDRNFVWAEATIDGSTVVASSRAVPKPVAVRYAWSAAIPWANLFNQDGLPAQAFRTDAWDLPGTAAQTANTPEQSAIPPTGQ